LFRDPPKAVAFSAGRPGLVAVKQRRVLSVAIQLTSSVEGSRIRLRPLDALVLRRWTSVAIAAIAVWLVILRVGFL
jgi:hypothetical protein